MKSIIQSDKLNNKEMIILKHAVDEAEKKKHKFVSSPQIQNIISIVEKFMKDNGFICYGGTAINNILPDHDKFYDRNLEIPDYDFFAPNALEEAKKLANIYYKASFQEVEAKAGIHAGTYKVYVNFIPIADITQMDPNMYKALKKDAIIVDGINYAPPNYLRMAAYLELSRPDGDISRWEKVLKRLVLLNKNYPINIKHCNVSNFIRKFETPHKNINTIYKIVRNSIIDQGLVFFGGFAIYSYGKYINIKERKQLLKHPDFDVLAIDPEISANIIKQKLENANIKNVKITKHSGIGENIASHYEVKVDDDIIAFLYKPLACHSYNIIKINNEPVKIATIDTMLSLYLAFLYANKSYYDPHRILCIAQYLFKVQIKNRLAQKGVLKRFSTKCYGKQSTLETIRAQKADRFKNLQNNKCSKDYEKYFLRYFPQQKSTCKNNIITRKSRKPRKHKNTSKKYKKTSKKYKKTSKKYKKTSRK